MSTANATAQRVGAVLRSVPIAIASAVATAVVAGVATGAVHHATGLVVATAIFGLVGTLVGVGWAERLMGHRRVLLAVLVACVVAVALHSTLSAFDISVHLYAARRGAAEPIFGPTIPAVGAIAAASAFAHPLTRRRIRLLGGTLLVVFVLYSGQAVDVMQAIIGLVGLALGMLLSGENPLRRRPATRREARGLLAAIVAITALGPIVTLIAPSSHGLLDPLGQLFLEPVRDWASLAANCPTATYRRGCAAALRVSRLDGPGPILLSILPLLMLLLAARGIRNGRRIGLWLAVGVNLVTAVVGIIYFGLVPLVADSQTSAFQIEAVSHFRVFVVVSLLFPLAVDVLLVSSLRMFPRDVDRRAALAFVALALGLLVTTAAALLGIGWLIRDQFSPVPTLEGLLRGLPELLFPAASLGFEPRDFTPVGPAAALLTGWIGPVFWVLLLGLAWVAIRRIGVGRAQSGPQLARRLARAGNGGAISWMTTWDGNDYWTAGSGALVAYRVINNVAITTGEPLAPRAEQKQVAAEFASFCLDHGWTPAFYSVGDPLRDELTQLGWTSLGIGEEAVVDVAAFSLRGKRMNSIRTALNRAEREGTIAVWTTWAELSASHAAQIIDLSESWVADKSLPELGFTVGGLDELKDPDVRLMLAVSSADRIEAVTSWMPTYVDGQVSRWTLDFMRQRRDAPNGTMEFVIASTILRAKEHGPAFLSLSGAPLVPADEAAPESRLTGFIAQSLEPLYGFRSLLAFKVKFQPTFERMWLLVPSSVALPAVGVAVARAYLPTLSARGAMRLLGGSRRGMSRR